MSILDGIAGILGTFRIPDRDKAQVVEEINFMEALTEHVQWKARLENYLNGTPREDLDPAAICRDDLCPLGKWIHGPGLRRYHKEPRFYQLRADHAHFHFLAGNVVRHVQSNEHAEAGALLENEYKRTSRKMVQALTELNTHLSG